MKVKRFSPLILWLVALLPVACVDSLDVNLFGTVNVVVVDGTLTNLPEPQTIRLNRSRADPLTGRFGTLPITNARVELVVDSAQVIPLKSTGAGTYELPATFRAEVGHSYQLRFSLPDGGSYQSDQQVMPAVPPIDKLTVRFNEQSLPIGLYPAGFRAGYDLFVTTRDPVNQQNQYRWDWKLYEKQKWCRSCYQGSYIDTIQQGGYQNGIYILTKRAVEDCVQPSVLTTRDYYNDYTCRSPCWDILTNNTINLFDDRITNGTTIANRRAGQVPLFTRQPALLSVRQLSLTATAYEYYRIFEQQTQNTGGLADTPPTAPVGNVRNRANPTERVVGYFTASAVSVTRYWLDKQDATRLPIGAYDELGAILQSDDELFYAQNKRRPEAGPNGPPFTPGGPSRFITAPCLPDEFRTPIKPEGWRD